jgi:hypothetical protein
MCDVRLTFDQVQLSELALSVAFTGDFAGRAPPRASLMTATSILHRVSNPGIPPDGARIVYRVNKPT